MIKYSLYLLQCVLLRWVAFWAGCTSVLVLLSMPVTAQDNLTQGMPFRVLARKADGALLTDARLQAQIAFFRKENGEQVLYRENHDFYTDGTGMATLIIGQGDVRSGDLIDIPWSSGAIWIDLDIRSPHHPDFRLRQKSPLRAVPYAFYANTSEQIQPGLPHSDLRTGSPNTRWLTAGNEATRPPYHFLGTKDDQPLYLVTNGEPRLILTKDGQLKFRAGDALGGEQTSENSYPVVVSGGRQGIWVELDESRNRTTNFLAFFEPEKDLGAIQGQTLSEWLAHWDYAYQNLIYVLDGVSLGIQAGILIADSAAAFAAAGCAIASFLPFPIFAWAAPGYILYGSGLIAENVSLIVEAAALVDESITWNSNLRNSMGVSYESGEADYAEWLPLENQKESISYGDIVGVRNGHITRQTDSVEHLLVVSQRPAVMGNRPEATSQLSAGRPVAFLGQVAVKVAGPVQVGDYILPSGKNDGIGIARSPEEMRAGDYARVIGIAWESKPNKPVQMVLVAVGLHRNAGHDRLEKMDQKIDDIVAFLEGEGPLPDRALLENPAACPTCSQQGMQRTEDILADFQQSMRQIDQPGAPLAMVEKRNLPPGALKPYESILKVEFAKGRKILRQRGIDLDRYPELADLFEDPLPHMMQTIQDPEYLKDLLQATYNNAHEKYVVQNE